MAAPKKETIQQLESLRDEFRQAAADARKPSLWPHRYPKDITAKVLNMWADLTDETLHSLQDSAETQKMRALSPFISMYEGLSLESTVYEERAKKKLSLYRHEDRKCAPVYKDWLTRAQTIMKNI